MLARLRRRVRPPGDAGFTPAAGGGGQRRPGAAFRWQVREGAGA